jgi:hypothetical protein
MMSARPFVVVAAAVVLAGCASHPVFEGGRAWSEGWREGKVEKLASGAELGYRQTYDCRYRNGGAGREAAGRYAVIGIEVMSRHRHHVVPVEPTREPQVGSNVLTNLRRCDPPVESAAR